MYYPARGRELLHGNLMTILNWLKYSGPKTGMKAVRAMLQMQNNNEGSSHLTMNLNVMHFRLIVIGELL